MYVCAWEWRLLLLEREEEGGVRISPVDIQRVWVMAVARDLDPRATTFTAAATATKKEVLGQR